MNSVIEATPPSPRRRGLWIALAILALGVATTVAVQQQKKRKASEAEKSTSIAIPVRVTTALSRDISSFVAGTANLVPEHQVELVAEIDGRVAALKVEEGDRVAASQVVIELAREDAAIALAKAKLRAENAAQAFERGRAMDRQSLMSPEQLERLTLERNVAAQELAEAEWRYQKTSIRSPLGGVVVARSAQLGQTVAPGQVLLTVADFSPLVARIHLPERDVLGLAEGRAVRLVLEADDQIVFPGRIRQISPVVDTATGTVKVTVEADAPPSAARPGAFVRIEIVRETRRNAVVVPKDALIVELKQAHVFVADGKIARRHAVELGIEQGAEVEIRSGLEAGARVIVAGQNGLEDGSPVAVLPDK